MFAWHGVHKDLAVCWRRRNGGPPEHRHLVQKKSVSVSLRGASASPSLMGTFRLKSTIGVAAAAGEDCIDAMRGGMTPPLQPGRGAPPCGGAMMVAMALGG
mmetsp:Transcript_59163/g.165255  ORF Transcript_59163/g.165255 Transcript_59163/m.165255 type:complete len:101 (-) Transcript_59163:53-355(-)